MQYSNTKPCTVGAVQYHKPEMTTGYHDLEELVKLKGYTSIEHMNVHYVIYWNQLVDGEIFYDVIQRRK